MLTRNMWFERRSLGFEELRLLSIQVQRIEALLWASVRNEHSLGWKTWLGFGLWGEEIHKIVFFKKITSKLVFKKNKESLKIFHTITSTHFLPPFAHRCQTAAKKFSLQSIEFCLRSGFSPTSFSSLTVWRQIMKLDDWVEIIYLFN